MRALVQDGLRIRRVPVMFVKQQRCCEPSWDPKSLGVMAHLPRCPGQSLFSCFLSSFPCPWSSSERGDSSISPAFLISLCIPGPQHSGAPKAHNSVETIGATCEPEEGRLAEGRQGSRSCPEALQCGWAKQAQITELLDHWLPEDELQSEESRNRSQFLEGWVV